MPSCCGCTATCGGPPGRRWPSGSAGETADFLLRELATEAGGFASALDADTDGVEGLTYAWTPDQLIEVLGEPDGVRAADLLSVTGPGTFELGTSTLQLRQDPDDPQWWQRIRRRCWPTQRNRRPQPARDDKVITAWNGLAIAALAEAGVLLDEPRYLAAAAGCARFLLDVALGIRPVAPLVPGRRGRRRGRRRRGLRRPGRGPARAAPGHRRSAAG